MKIFKRKNKEIEINQDDYNTAIGETSVFNWNICLNGDYRYTRKNLKKGNELNDSIAWISVYDDYIKRIGLGKNYEYILEMQRDLAILQCDFIIDNDRFLLNSINTLKDLIDETIINSKKGGEDMTTTLIKLGKWAGFKLNEKETTVLELHRMIDLVVKESQNKPKK